MRRIPTAFTRRVGVARRVRPERRRHGRAEQQPTVAPPTIAGSAPQTPAGPPAATHLDRTVNHRPAPPSVRGCPATGRGAGEKEAPGSANYALYLVRVGRHDCYDHVNFSINGPAAIGYSVRCFPPVTADASGKPLPVGGAAMLQVVVRHPEQGADTCGHQAGRTLAATGGHLYPAAQLAGRPSLRGALRRVLRGAVHVRGRHPRETPFRVLTLLDEANQVGLVVPDIAH
ncbi:AMIN-like domain-containing (lipo)protein [Amycolatopsis panacis]|uniref:AMIN-like domain-containing protein n=1 Tax=Amycolatopsis panacis TaxID=2340917 RepID=A0A419I717_9PSEU|nr:hypothetical protein [Amycolatopsis panacis]RJQ87242.1 hypothetical protein D5S19_09915 [Amycolatopsis panacis]